MSHHSELPFCLCLGILYIALTGCSNSWRDKVSGDVQLYGHRNWIAIVDSAYPAQTRAGVETIATGADEIEVVHAVLAELAGSSHVRPKLMLDAELPAVAEADAPGITRYRADLAKELAGKDVQSLPHEQIIAKLDNAGATFRVLVLKTNLALPYTSVFIELDCGYWSAEAEQRLRAKLNAK
jgi:L-fucose mutarotase/ribose pyranase (RbsD/FucU family)